MMTAVRFTIPAMVLVGIACVSSVASAQDASGWDSQPHTAARLIAGALSKSTAAPILRAGVELKLDPGWHTYWRDPGDTGVPPTFDFSGSDNVRSATVLWPAPERFSDGAGGTSIGYVDHVILPLQVAPIDAAKQPRLHLKLGYAICGNLCVPAEANLQLALNGDGAEDAAIEQAEVRVPRRVPLGPNAGPGGGLASARSCRHRRCRAGGRAGHFVRRRADARLGATAAGTDGRRR
jgi:DsbC/DsbD-like thiol-disulfide interchange protein